MANTINLLPVKTGEQIKTDLKKFKYDVYAALLILFTVTFAVIFLVVNAYMEYVVNTASSTLNSESKHLESYRPLAGQYYILNEKYTQAVSISSSKVDPDDIITYIQTLVPSSATLSDFSVTDKRSFTVTISSGNYLDVAKFLFALENPNLKLQGTEIKDIQLDHTQNIVNFVITGTYNG